MSSIEINHVKILGETEQERVRSPLSATIQSALRHIGNCGSHGIAVREIYPTRKFFASQNIISVSDIEEVDYLVVSSICLNDKALMEKFLWQARHVKTDHWSVFNVDKEYGEFVVQCFPDLVLSDTRGNMAKLFYIDVMSVDHHHERLLFLTRESAQTALTAILEAI